MIMCHIGYMICYKLGAKDSLIKRNVACLKAATQLSFKGTLAHSLEHMYLLQLWVYCMLHILHCKPGELIGSAATFQPSVVQGNVGQLMANQV